MLTYRSSSSIIILIVYVDDIIIINGNDSTGFANLNTHQGKQFHNKDLGFLRYFPGVKVELVCVNRSMCWIYSLKLVPSVLAQLILQ